MHFTKTLLPLVLFLESISPAISGSSSKDEIYLECKGSFHLCAKNENAKHCDRPIQHKYVIAWNGQSLKHMDDFGVLDFSSGCKVTEQYIFCSDPRFSDPSNPNMRNVQIDRVTGNVIYELTNDIYEKSKLRDMGFTKNAVKFEGVCSKRLERNLF